MKGMISFLFILLIMPLGHAFMIIVEHYYAAYMVHAAVLLVILGILITVATRWVASEGWQTLMGALGGVFMWTGGAEYGFVFAAHRFHVPAVGTTKGEYMLMEYTWGILIPATVYILFQESVRCSPVLWLRRKLHLMRKSIAAGPIHNYGPRVAFEMTMVLWFCYVVMLIAYDIGIHSWATYALFVIALGGGSYALYQLYHKPAWGIAIRYAIPTVIIVWIDVEILGKWGVYTEPWIVLNKPIMISILLAFAFAAYLLIDNLRTQKAQKKIS